MDDPDYVTPRPIPYSRLDCRTCSHDQGVSISECQEEKATCSRHQVAALPFRYIISEHNSNLNLSIASDASGMEPKDPSDKLITLRAIDVGLCRICTGRKRSSSVDGRF